MVSRNGVIGFPVVLDNGVSGYIRFNAELVVEDKNAEIFEKLIFSGIRSSKSRNNNGQIIDFMFAAKDKDEKN